MRKEIEVQQFQNAPEQSVQESYEIDTSKWKENNENDRTPKTFRN